MHQQLQSRAATARVTRVVAMSLFAMSLVAAACGSDDTRPLTEDVNTQAVGLCDGPSVEPVQIDTAIAEGTTIRLETHDSFAVSDGVLAAFTEQTGIGVDVVQVGDAGSLVSSAILTKGNPTADVIFGIDNTFLCRGLDAGLFAPFEASLLVSVNDELQLDPLHRVTPIDYGDVCANYWIDALPGEVPVTLDDLIDPVNRGQFVTQNPETSSPGFAFLLATIARYGEEGWEAYWQSLVDNDVLVTPDWDSAYYGEFVAGGGPRSIVMSYASSPAAEVIFADPPVATPPTGVLRDSCYRQIEFAGILAGSSNQAAAAKLVEFMLSPTFQEDIPLNMFVYPANAQAELPAEFVEYAPLSDDALSLDPALIEAHRGRWTERFTELVLR